MKRSSHSDARNALKAQLDFERGYKTCPLCNKNRATDMHEAFVNKGAVMCLPPERRGAINHPYNCILICNDCNLHITAEKEHLARRLLAQWAGMRVLPKQPRESVSVYISAGVIAIQGWINSLGLKLPVNVATLI